MSKTVCKESQMSEILIMLVVIGGWFLLQYYILPKIGIST